MDSLLYSDETCSQIEREAMVDFKEAVQNIDFKKYNPYSSDFMKALSLGQMWDLVKKLNTCTWCKGSFDSGEFGDIVEELDGAKKYQELYEMTGDKLYKDMAKDELKHAGVLINKHRADADTNAKANTLNSFAKEHQMISNKLESTQIEVS